MIITEFPTGKPGKKLIEDHARLLAQVMGWQFMYAVYRKPNWIVRFQADATNTYSYHFEYSAARLIPELREAIATVIICNLFRAWFQRSMTPFDLLMWHGSADKFSVVYPLLDWRGNLVNSQNVKPIGISCQWYEQGVRHTAGADRETMRITHCIYQPGKFPNSPQRRVVVDGQVLNKKLFDQLISAAQEQQAAHQR